MSLLEEHKANRRERILNAARELIAERGYAGLTMRELARASRVSVPTLYNLLGSKHAILAAEMENTFTVVAASLAASPPGSDFAERALATTEVSLREMLQTPCYCRELTQLLAVSPELETLRRTMEERYVTMMEGNLRYGQECGHLAEWVHPRTLARQLFTHYISVYLRWGLGELDDDSLRASSIYGMCLLLLSASSGPAKQLLEQRAREVQDSAHQRRLDGSAEVANGR